MIIKKPTKLTNHVTIIYFLFASFCVIPAQSDLITFVSIKNHFKQNQELSTQLFTPETRTDTLRELYDAAAKTPVYIMDEIDSLMGYRERRSSDAFLCTPVLGQLRYRMKRKVDLEIEAGKVSWTQLKK